MCRHKPLTQQERYARWSCTPPEWLSGNVWILPMESEIRKYDFPQSAKHQRNSIGIAHQQERCPVIRVGMLIANGQHGRSQALALSSAGGQIAIERFHQIRGRPVIDIPQTKNNRSCACVEKAANQTQQFVTGHDVTKTGTASAQSHQTRRCPKIIDIEKIDC